MFRYILVLCLCTLFYNIISWLRNKPHFGWLRYAF